jgi:hypothetical protein
VQGAAGHLSVLTKKNNRNSQGRGKAQMAADPTKKFGRALNGKSWYIL